VIRQLVFICAAGKTGTTTTSTTPVHRVYATLSVSVWVGFDRGMSMRDPQAAHHRRPGAARSGGVHAQGHRGRAQREFVVPSGIASCRSCDDGQPVLPGPRAWMSR